MTDQLDLDQIETRAAAASEGPWRLSDDYTDIHAADGEHLASYCHTADGEFIAHAQTDVPAMAKEIRRLRAELAAARATVLAEVADELEGIDFHPNAKSNNGELCRLLAGRFRRKAAAEETHVVADDSDNPEPTDRCGARHYQHPDTVCTEPADHYRPTADPHAGPLILDGRECGGAAWDDPDRCSGCRYVPCTDCTARL